MFDFIFARNVDSVISQFAKIIQRLERVMVRFERKAEQARLKKEKAEKLAEYRHQQGIDFAAEIARAQVISDNIRKLVS